jgi:hypothetical protein
MHKHLLALVILFNCVCGFSNSPQNIEQELLTHLHKIDRLQHHQGKYSMRNGSFDSLIVENRLFKAKLLQYTTEEASTFTFAFDSLRKYIYITNSDDNKLRVYSWHTGDSESMCFYNNIYQYQSGSNIFSTTLTEDDAYNPRGYFTDIQSLKRDSDTVYLGYFHAFYSPKDFSDSYETFRIEGDKLQDSIPIFKVKNVAHRDTVLSSLFVLFNPITTKNWKKNHLLFLDSKKKILKVRQTDSDGNILHKNTSYSFNGKEFEIPQKETK